MRESGGHLFSPYDVIVVLGAAVWPHGQPSPTLRRRVEHAVHLWHGGAGRVLLMTGGLGTHPPAEGQLMRQLALAAGVPAACLVVEDQATSTFESGLYCADIIRQHGWSTVLVVTDAYHLPRTLLVFRSLGIPARSHAVHAPRFPRHFRRFCITWGREILAYGWYLLRLLVFKVRQSKCHR